MKRDYYSQRFLSNDIRSHSQEDDLDFPADWGQFEDWPPRKITSCVRENHGIELMREFSDCNQNSLLSEFMKVRESAKVIVEIGVARLSTNFYEHTSTTILLNNKLDSTIYLGIDVDDKSFLNDPAKNIFTLQSQSENYEIVQLKLNELGITKIDFLFIDGWHSLNAVINDWQYVDMLSDNGIVIFHDSNYHPGPTVFVEAIDSSIFRVEKHFEGQDDYGVAIAYRIQK